MGKPVPKDLLDILACPKCKADLDYFQEKDLLVCRECRHEYKVEDGIPIMLVGE